MRLMRLSELGDLIGEVSFFEQYFYDFGFTVHPLPITSRAIAEPPTGSVLLGTASAWILIVVPIRSTEYHTNTDSVVMSFGPYPCRYLDADFDLAAEEYYRAIFDGVFGMNKTYQKVS